jgi:hypothetical protein
MTSLVRNLEAGSTAQMCRLVLKTVERKAIAVRRDAIRWGVVRQGKVVCEDVLQTREIGLERIWGRPK